MDHNNEINVLVYLQVRKSIKNSKRYLSNIGGCQCFNQRNSLLIWNAAFNNLVDLSTLTNFNTMDRFLELTVSSVLRSSR